MGSAAEWIAAGKTTPLPEWVTGEENAVRNEVIGRSGYDTPLNWSAIILIFN